MATGRTSRGRSGSGGGRPAGCPRGAGGGGGPPGGGWRWGGLVGGLGGGGGVRRRAAGRVHEGVWRGARRAERGDREGAARGRGAGHRSRGARGDREGGDREG